jgi:hypothetical protein
MPLYSREKIQEVVWKVGRICKCSRNLKDAETQRGHRDTEGTQRHGGDTETQRKFVCLPVNKFTG